MKILDWAGQSKIMTPNPVLGRSSNNLFFFFQGSTSRYLDLQRGRCLDPKVSDTLHSVHVKK